MTNHGIYQGPKKLPGLAHFDPNHQSHPGGVQRIRCIDPTGCEDRVSAGWFSDPLSCNLFDVNPKSCGNPRIVAIQCEKNMLQPFTTFYEGSKTFCLSEPLQPVPQLPVHVTNATFTLPKDHVVAIRAMFYDDGVTVFAQRQNRAVKRRTMTYLAYQNVCSFDFICLLPVKNILFNLYVQTLDVFSAKQLWNIPTFKMMLEFYFMFHRPKRIQKELRIRKFP
jgi:hypothetical protein